jgi:hypothetical protein
MWGPPATELISRVTIPLTEEYTYNEFIDGIRPIRKRITREHEWK